MKKSTKKGSFPAKIFVTREEREGFLLAQDDLDQLSDDEWVATYQLVDVKRLKITRELRQGHV